MKKLISIVKMCFLFFTVSASVQGLLLCKTVYAADSLKNLEKKQSKSAAQPKKTAKAEKKSANAVKKVVQLAEKTTKTIKKSVKSAKEPPKSTNKSSTLVEKTAKEAKKSAKTTKDSVKQGKEAEESTQKSKNPAKKTPELAKKKQTFTKPEMLAIKGGCFQTDNSESEKEGEENSQQVCVKDFEIGQYEVTQAQWQTVMNDNPSYFKGKNLPVERVSWKDVQNFIEKLNAKTSQHYRLPTEDEWFFACQAGHNSEFCGSDNIDEVAWYQDNANKTTHAVGKKVANAWGIYDMSGNVMEWVSSCDDANCSEYVLRGGSWRGSGSQARSVIRFNDLTNYRFNSIGFRLALSH